MVAVDHVSKAFGEVLAVEDAQFTVGRGEFLTILGPSGSGKTTLLRMIAGFSAPTKGEIYINGRPVSSVPAYKRAIGMVFQRLALFPHMTAAENVAYPLKMRRFDRTEIPTRVERYLELVRLGGYGARAIHELSGGQQQRVAIARALVFEPDLLLLDEPLASLDKKLREEMQLEFRRIQQELGVTTINVTHDQREALVMSDHVVVMDQGRVQQKARPRDAYWQPSNSFVAGFIGVTNFLTGTVLSVAAGRVEVRVGDVDLKGRGALDEGAVGRPVECAIRAEHLHIFAPDERPADLDVCLDATVSEVIFEGDRLVYTVQCPSLSESSLRLFDHNPLKRQPFDAGDAVRVGWSSRDLLVFPE